MKKDTTAFGAVRPTWDKRDCSVRALSCALECSYQQASGIFSAAGRTLSKGTSVNLSVDVHEKWLRMKPLVGVSNWPLSAFLAAYPQGSYVLHKRGHAFAVVSGTVHDWENATKPQTKIERGWEVTEETRKQVEKTKALFE